MVSLSNHADVEPEQIGQERRKPREGDPLREAQIDDEGAQVLPVLRRAQEASLSACRTAPAP